MPAPFVKKADTYNAERGFWQMAALSASATSNRHRTYASLQKQYRATRPDANHLEHEQAMARLAKLCKV